MSNSVLSIPKASQRDVRLVFMEFSLASAVSTLNLNADKNFVSSVTNNGTGVYDVVLKHLYRRLLGATITIVQATASNSKWQVLGELSEGTLDGATVSIFSLGNIDLETPALSAPPDCTVKVCLILEGGPSN